MKRLLRAVRNPVEMVLSLYAYATFLYSVYILSPWYVVDKAESVRLSIPERPAELVFGFLMLALSMSGVLLPFTKNKEKVGKRAALCLFIIFLFLTISRLLIFGPFPLTWLPLLVISLTCGGLRLYYEVRKT